MTASGTVRRHASGMTRRHASGMTKCGVRVGGRW